MKLTPQARIEKLEKELAALKATVNKPMGFVKPTVETASPELRSQVAKLIEADASRTEMRPNGYKWPNYMASKVYYAAKATNGGKIDPAGMSDTTVRVIASAYGIK